VTEWLDLMLDEVRRKNAEEAEAADEAESRGDASGEFSSKSQKRQKIAPPANRNP